MRVPHIQWQIFWANWWQLYPTYQFYKDPFAPTIHVVSFWVFQAKWFLARRIVGGRL